MKTSTLTHDAAAMMSIESAMSMKDEEDRRERREREREKGERRDGEDSRERKYSGEKVPIADVVDDD